MFSTLLLLFIYSNPIKAIEFPCSTLELKLTTLQQLKNNNFIVKSNITRHKIALLLVQCLANLDLTIRDDIAFTALSLWLREKKLDENTQLSLFNSLINVIDTSNEDISGLHKSFVTLVLSELARADRESTYLNSSQRQHLVNNVTSYLTNLQDYRGFDESIGWRHGIAHSADLIMQLALNSKITKQQLDFMLGALAQKVNTDTIHFYIYGESKRLARAVFYIFDRGLHSHKEWMIWFNEIKSPAPFKRWEDIYNSQLGLSKRHNTRAFISELFILSQKGKKSTIIAINESTTDALQIIN
jgi:hypothetical protein